MGKMVFIFLLFYTHSSLAITRYTVNGKSINLNNGRETADLTGTVIGKDEDTQAVVNERRFEKGVEVFMKTYREDGGFTEANFNEKHNRHGEFRDYWSKNRLKEEARYDNGRNIGWRKRWNASGNLEFEEFYGNKPIGNEWVKFSRSFNSKKQIERIQCHPEDPPTEFKELCGFNGAANTVNLYNSAGELDEKRTYLNSNIISRVMFEKDKKVQEITMTNDIETTTKYYPNGHIKTRVQRKKDSDNRFNYDGVEQGFFEEGTPAYEAHWAANQLMSYKEYFMNKAIALELSNLKTKNSHEPEYYFKEYFDSGSISREGQGALRINFSPGSWAGGAKEKIYFYNSRPVGVQKNYFENGKLEIEQTYNSDGKLDGTLKKYYDTGDLREESLYKAGVLLAKKEYDTDKRLVLDRTYYPDGSVKEKRQ